ncbi:glycosyltransferase family 2 protein [Aquibium carbonis]|uniref:Glycosyltransferase family 2 protein n=1 Tax=Aquibium carbonis TaxID=2495581 RepID=A0A429Z0N6_9HYPH|nr:glycosyltransferase family A protein [Aquibium carbonis]RST87204.1 glycosyltransferase family 2 protein [Aquibium carbonis]
MKLSVIVPVFNRERFVAAALRSLLRQRDTIELDIIVVDDGSTDRSRDIVEALAALHGGIRLLTQDNGGVARARNTGLRSLPGDADLVSFLDSDDFSPAGRFIADISHFSDPSIEFVYGRLCKVDRLDDERLLPDADAKLETVRGIQLAAGLFRRSFIDRVGLFNESFQQGEDTDYLFRAFEQRRNAVFTDTVGVYYRQHGDSLTNNSEDMRRGFIRALSLSAQRRRRNPSLARLDTIFGQPDATTVQEA